MMARVGCGAKKKRLQRREGRPHGGCPYHR